MGNSCHQSNYNTNTCGAGGSSVTCCSGLDGSNTFSLHISHSFKQLGLASFHLGNHALELLVVVGIVAGATSRQRALALLLAVVLASTICPIPLGQLLLLFLGQILEFIKLVVTEGNFSCTFPRLLAISTQTTLMRFTPSTRDIGLKKKPPLLCGLHKNRARGCQESECILKVDALVSIILTYCSHISKDRRINRLEGIEEVGDLCLIIWDLYWNMLSALS
jgi:hypothetical protein